MRRGDTSETTVTRASTVAGPRAAAAASTASRMGRSPGRSAYCFATRACCSAGRLRHAARIGAMAASGDSRSESLTVARRRSTSAFIRGQLAKPKSRATASWAAARVIVVETERTFRSASSSCAVAARCSSRAWRRSWPRSGRSGSSGMTRLFRSRGPRAALGRRRPAVERKPADLEVDSVLPADPVVPSRTRLPRYRAGNGPAIRHLRYPQRRRKEQADDPGCTDCRKYPARDVS